MRRLKFGLRGLLSLIAFLAVSFAMTSMFLQERLRYANTLSRTLSESGAITCFIGSGCIELEPHFSNNEPTLSNRIWANTGSVSRHPQFVESNISPKAAQIFLNTCAASRIYKTSFFRTTISEDVPFFLTNWKSCELVEFNQTPLPKAWKASLKNDPGHIRRMLFAGETAMSLDDFCQLDHLEVLVLSHTGLRRNEIAKIREALPNTVVVLSNFRAHPNADSYGQKLETPQIRDVAELERQVGIDLPEAMVDFLNDWRKESTAAPFFALETVSVLSLDHFQSSDGEVYTRIWIPEEQFDGIEVISALKLGVVENEMVWMDVESGKFVVGEPSDRVRFASHRFTGQLNLYPEILVAQQ